MLAAFSVVPPEVYNTALVSSHFFSSTNSPVWIQQTSLPNYTGLFTLGRNSFRVDTSKSESLADIQSVNSFVRPSRCIGCSKDPFVRRTTVSHPV